MAPMENEGTADLKDPLPREHWAGGEGIPKPKLLPVLTGLGTGRLLAKGAMGGPPNTIFLVEILGLPKAKGVFWGVRPWVF